MARKYLKKIVKKQLKEAKKLFRLVKEKIFVGELYTNNGYYLKALKNSQIKNNTINLLEKDLRYKSINNNIQFLITGEPIIIKFIMSPTNTHSRRYKIAIPVLLKEEFFYLLIDENSFNNEALKHILL